MAGCLAASASTAHLQCFDRNGLVECNVGNREYRKVSQVRTFHSDIPTSGDFLVNGTGET